MTLARSRHTGMITIHCLNQEHVDIRPDDVVDLDAVVSGQTIRQWVGPLLSGFELLSEAEATVYAPAPAAAHDVPQHVQPVIESTAGELHPAQQEPPSDSDTVLDPVAAADDDVPDPAAPAMSADLVANDQPADLGETPRIDSSTIPASPAGGSRPRARKRGKE